MDGIIIINKTKGCTSHDIVYKIKKMLNEKVGHTGTLDPMAEGVLPILVGKGTLTSKYLINHDKKYIVDGEGRIVKQQPVNKEILTTKNIEKILQSFVGKQEQIPPIYSAIKINGKKLYEYARKGQEIELKPRKIEIYNIKLINYSVEEKQIKFEVFCGKGTYIRSLCEDIAIKFGTVGYMKSLKRIQVGDFKIEDSITIDELNNIIQKNELDKTKTIITLEKLFEKIPSIRLDNRKLELFLNGVMLTQKQNEGVYKIYNQKDEFIGTGTIKDNLLKRDIIL
jgi:tRNA pseudouridine55 synthase